jgi:hypothetical protein
MTLSDSFHGVVLKVNVNFKGSVMKNCTLVFLSVSAILFSLGVYADESVIKESKPAGLVLSLSKEDVQKGLDNGTLCIDHKGRAHSRGAFLSLDKKIYRCVKVYGENLSENKKLAWVELILRNDEAVTAD